MMKLIPVLLLSFLSKSCLSLQPSKANQYLNSGGHISFSECLESLGSSVVTVLLPENSAFVNASMPWNIRLTYVPAAIVYPTSAEGVAQSINCAAQSGINVSARSGGHSYASFGLGGKNGSLVIDVSKMKSVQVDNATGYAVAQTGNTLGDLALAIYAQGNRTLPHGTCPYVGTGGHASFGGYGPYSRVHGLLSDRTVAAEVVLANGTILDVSNTSHPDLFWALRGAAPSFGVVTAWTFSTIPPPVATTNFNLQFAELSEAEITSMLIDYQAWVYKGVPDAFSNSIWLLRSGDSSITVFMQGEFYGPENEFNSTFQSLLDVLPSNYTLSVKTFTDWIEALNDRDGSLNTSIPEDPNAAVPGFNDFFAKSYLSSEPLSNASIANWQRYLHTAGFNTDISWFIEIDMHHGAIARVPRDETAYWNRDARLNFQLYGYQPLPFPSDGVAFVNGMLASIDPAPKAAYPNYVDPTLTPEQWHSQYFGGHYARLSEIRKRYDPLRVFKFPQYIE